MIAAGSAERGLRPAERGQRRMSRHRGSFRRRQHRARLRRADAAPRRVRGGVRRRRRRADRRAQGHPELPGQRGRPASRRRRPSTTTGRSTAAPKRPPVVEEIATADIVTTAVGPTILKFVAPVIVAGLRARGDEPPPLVVMACENAINATDVLAEHVRDRCRTTEWAALARKAIFANTAVDRIVPAQAADAGLDVTVETYFEWAIERPPFGGNEPAIPDATWVRRPRAVHRAKAVHRQHRSRVDGLPRVRQGHRQAQRRAGRRRGARPRCRACWPRPSNCWWTSTSSPRGAAGLRRQDPAAGSPTRTCRTPSTGWAGNRCASCPARSG